jgi:phosphotransferase system  glucose/maltose/N-acetylglucosamine-specific IIC component
MATKKKDSGNQVKGGMGFSSGFRSSLGGGSNVADDKKRDDENVPWSLIVVVMAVLLMFFIIMPVLAFMYYDMYFATQAAVQEVRKMKDLRREILEERLYGR